RKRGGIAGLVRGLLTDDDHVTRHCRSFVCLGGMRWVAPGRRRPVRDAGSEPPGQAGPQLTAALDEAAALVLSRRTALRGAGQLAAEDAAVLAVVVGAAADHVLVGAVAADQGELPAVVAPAQPHVQVEACEGVL